MKSYNKHFVIYMSIAVFTLLLSLTGISFASWQIVNSQNSSNSIITGCFSVEFTEDTQNGAIINLTNTYPMAESKGKTLTPYIFRVKNTCNVKVKYDITLDVAKPVGGATLIPVNKIKVYMTGTVPLGPSMLGGGTFNTVAIPDSSTDYSTSYLIASSVAINNQNDQNEHQLRLWVDESATLDNVPSGSELKLRLTVNSYAYQ